MKRKIFLSINLPDRSKNRLVGATQEWQILPVKWTKIDNLHLTLVFLGYTETDDLEDICQKVSYAAGKSQIFDIGFDTIRLFPSKEDPKMICLTGDPDENLKNLVADIEDALEISRGPKKIFRPHITLGRIRKHKWEALEPQVEILQKFDLVVSAETVDVMASDFERDGNIYSVIQSCPLS